MTDLQLDLPVLCDDGIPVEMCVTDNITAREILQQVIAFRKASCPALVISITDCALSIDAGGTVRILSLDSRVDLSSYATSDPYQKSGTPLVINAFGFRAKAAEALRCQTLNDYLISKAVLELRYLIQSSTAYRQSETDRITSHDSYNNRQSTLIDAERILSETLRRDNIFSTRATSSSSSSTGASVKDSKGRADHTFKSLNAHSDTENNASNTGSQESLEALVHERYLDFSYNVRGILHDSGLLDSGAGRELINKAENLIQLGDVCGLSTAIFDYEQGNQSEQSASTVSPKHCTPHDRLVGSTSKRGLEEVTGHSGVMKFQRSETPSSPTLSADAVMGYRARQNIDFSTQSSTDDFFSVTAVENVSPTASVAQQNDGTITQPSCHTVAEDISNARSSSSDNGKCFLSGQQGAVASEDENEDEDEDDMIVPVLQEDTAGLSPRYQSLKSSLDKISSSSPCRPTALELEHNGRLLDTGWTDTTTKTASASPSASASASGLLLPTLTHDIGKDNAVNMDVSQCIEDVEVTNDSDLRVAEIAALAPARVCATVGYNHRDVTSTDAAASSSASVVRYEECSLAATASSVATATTLSSSSSARPLLPLATAETTATATAAIVSTASSSISDRLDFPLAPHISGEISSQVISVSEAASAPCIGRTSSVLEEGCGSMVKAPLKECAASTVPGALDDEAKHSIWMDVDVDEGSRPFKHEVFESNQNSGVSGTAGEGEAKIKHQGSDSLQAHEDCESVTEHAERSVIGTKETSAIVQMEVVIEEEGQYNQAGEEVRVEMDDLGDAAVKEDTTAILDSAVEMVQRSDGDLDSISVLDVQIETEVENGGDVQAGVKAEEEIDTVRKDDSPCEGRAESDTRGAIEGQRDCEESHLEVIPIQADGEAVVDTHTGSNTGTAHETEEDGAIDDIQRAFRSGGVKDRAVVAGGQCTIVGEEDEEEVHALEGEDGSGAAKSDEGVGGGRKGEVEGGEGGSAHSQTDHKIHDSVVSGAEAEPENVNVHADADVDIDAVVDVEEGVIREDDEDQNVLEEDEDSDEDDVSFLPFQVDSALILTQPRLQDRGDSQETFYEKSSCDLLYGNQNSILDLAPSSSSRFDGSNYDDAEEDEDGGSGFHTADDDVAVDAATTPKDQNSTFSPSIASIAATDDSSDGIPCGQPLPLSHSQSKRGGGVAVLAGSDDEQMADSVGVEKGAGGVRVTEEVRDPVEEEIEVKLPGVRVEELLPSEGEGQEIPGQESSTPTGTAESPTRTQQDPSYRDTARADDQSNLILEASLRKTRTRTRAGTGAVLAADLQRVCRAEQLAEQKRYLEARRAALEREECRADAVSSTDPSSSSDEESDSSVVLIESARVRDTVFNGFDTSAVQGTASAADRRGADDSSNAIPDVTHTQDDSGISDASPRRKRGRPPKQLSELLKSNLKALQAAQKKTQLIKKMAINDQSPSRSALNSGSDGAESGVINRIVRPYRVREICAISRAVTRQRSHARDGADLDSSPDGSPALNDSTRQPHLPDASATIDHSNSETSDMPPMSPSGAATTPSQHSTQDPGSPIPRFSTVKKALRSPMGNRMTTRTAVRTESPVSVTQAQAVARGRGGDDVQDKKGMGKELPSPVEDVVHIEEEDSGTYEEVVTSVDEEENDDGTSEEESAGDDGDGDYVDEESESLADEEALNESSTRVPKSKSTPKIPKKKIAVTAKSSKEASQGVKVKRPVVAIKRPVVAVVRRDVVNREPLHHPTKSPPSSPSSEEPEVEIESEEAVAGAEGVDMGAVERTRKPTKALSARAQDAIRRKSLLGQVEDYTKRASILGSIFSDSSGSDADSRIERVKSSEGGSGAIDEDALDSMNGATSDISDDLDKSASSDSDSGSDSHEEEGHIRDVEDERTGSIRHDDRVPQHGRNQSSGNSIISQGHVSKLSTEKDSSDEVSDVLTATSTTVKKRLSFQQSAADKGPMHRPPSSGSTASTSSSRSYLSPRGPGTVFPPRKSPLIYSQDTVTKKPAAALPLPLPAINLKKFDTPFATINSSDRGSINRKRPLQAMLTAQPSFTETASTGLAQRKQPEPEPQPESEQEPDHSDLETLPSAVSPLENSKVSRLNAANMVRRQKKMRKDERKENHKRSLDTTRAAQRPPFVSTASASSIFSDSDTDASHAANPREKGRQEEGEDSASSADAIEESEEQKRLRRVAACEKLLQNRRSSIGAGENTRADVNVQQRADKRKDREGDDSISKDGRKRGRPPGALNQKKDDRRKPIQPMQSGRTSMKKKRTSSAPSTRQSTGSLKPRDSPGGDSHRAQGLTQGADSAGVSAPRGYRTSISLSSLSSIGMGVGTGMGAHAKAVNGVSLSTLTGAGKVRPFPAAITFNAQASGDRGTSTSTTSRTDSSSSSSRKDSSRSKSARPHLSNVESCLV